ncbi:MAG TPA: energy-coupling factor transporter transmembrane component T [Anaerolineaceae bacterium]|nr:energy-coupling factor transporter transmembrane component T [Anaerolineaceae bacterium]
MNEFEFLRYMTIGQYIPTGSILHRLDARVRLLAAIIILGAITFTVHPLGLGICLVIVLVGYLVARIPLSYGLRGMLAPLPFLVFLAILQVFFNPHVVSSPQLINWGIIHITVSDLWAGGMLMMRFMALIMGLTLVSAVISTTEIINGLEGLLSPLSRLGVPVQDFVMVVQVTLHFIPFLAQAAERIAKAQASRGADWGTHSGGLFQRVRQVFPLIVPLFLTSLRRAENLALAMEARGYGSQTRRTSMVVMRMQVKDGLALLGAVVIALVVLL